MTKARNADCPFLLVFMFFLLIRFSLCSGRHRPGSFPWRCGLEAESGALRSFGSNTADALHIGFRYAAHLRSRSMTTQFASPPQLAKLYGHSPFSRLMTLNDPCTQITVQLPARCSLNRLPVRHGCRAADKRIFMLCLPVHRCRRTVHTSRRCILQPQDVTAAAKHGVWRLFWRAFFPFFLVLPSVVQRGIIVPVAYIL